jgi:hypothetical protein
VPGRRHADAPALDRAARGLDAGDRAVRIAPDAGDLAVLDDVDAERIGARA